MANWLKRLRISSVDLCRKGANPMARIALSKSSDGDRAEWLLRIGEALENADMPESIAQSIRAALAEGGYDAAIQCAGREAGNYDGDDEPEDARGDGTDGDAQARTARRYYGDGESADGEREKGGQTDAQGEKRCGSTGRHGSGNTANGRVGRRSDGHGTAVDGYMRAPVHPEVRKALDEVRTLRDGLARESMVALAKKYDGVCSGVSREELADRFARLKSAGGGAYDEYVELLDELVESRRVAPLMKEYGSSRRADASLEGHVAEIMRAHPEMSRAQAVVKAYQSDPELPEII